MTEMTRDELISALVDQDFTGLTESDVNAILELLHENPELFGACQLDIATKLLLSRHRPTHPCPGTTEASIRQSIERLYRTAKATMR